MGGERKLKESESFLRFVPEVLWALRKRTPHETQSTQSKSMAINGLQRTRRDDDNECQEQAYLTNARVLVLVMISELLGATPSTSVAVEQQQHPLSLTRKTAPLSSPLWMTKYPSPAQPWPRHQAAWKESCLVLSFVGTLYHQRSLEDFGLLSQVAHINRPSQDFA